MDVLFNGLPSLLRSSPTGPCRNRFADAVFLSGEAAWLNTPRLPPSPVPVPVREYLCFSGDGNGFWLFCGRIGEDISVYPPLPVEEYDEVCRMFGVTYCWEVSDFCDWLYRS